MYLAEYVKQKLERHGVEPVAERLVTDVRYNEHTLVPISGTPNGHRAWVPVAVLVESCGFLALF